MALGECLLVLFVSWEEGRAALDLLLGHVVRLGALPGVSGRKLVIVILDAAPAREGAAHLHDARQVEGG